MKILNHPACTHQLGAPSDMQDGSCDALPVMYQTTEHGTFAVSFWQPDADDLAELLAGGGINLWVRAPGRQHPVVALGTFPAQEQPQDKDVALFKECARVFGASSALSEVRAVWLTRIRAENKTLRDELDPWMARGVKDAEEIAALRNKVAALEQKAAQLWEGLGAFDHTEAMQSLSALLKEAQDPADEFAFMNAAQVIHRILQGAGPMEERDATGKALLDALNAAGCLK